MGACGEWLMVLIHGGITLKVQDLWQNLWGLKSYFMKELIFRLSSLSTVESPGCICSLSHSLIHTHTSYTGIKTGLCRVRILSTENPQLSLNFTFSHYSKQEKKYLRVFYPQTTLEERREGPIKSTRNQL